MTDAKEHTRQTKAVVALTEACFKIAKRFDVCALCLMYAAADAAADAQEHGMAFHICGLENIHPPHKTVL